MTTGGRHWPEYVIEGVLLGLFMVAACAFATALEHPVSPLHAAIPDATGRRMLMGLAMGTTAIALVRSPWGQQSGAHMNPSLTLTYFRLGRVRGGDALGYALGQFVGGVAGIGVARLALGALVAHPHVRFAATAPGMAGVGVAFAAEGTMSALLMTVVLVVSNSRRWARWTPWCCGALIATYITLEAPLSGMSMNPARSFASALGAGQWQDLWIYFTAPPLGMLAAAEAFVRLRGTAGVRCAKLYHFTTRRCIFRCRWAQA